MLPEFKNEEEFRDNWIRPFLTKLGYVLVKNTHGAGEHGKDFFFGEFDRFGHLKISAVQAKVGNIGVGRKLDELLDQVKRCFTVKLRFHHGVHERRVSSVYVMTNGTISEHARQQLHDWCDREPNGENVYFLNGEQLDNQERFASYQEDNLKRQTLANLLIELEFIKVQLQKFVDDATKLPPDSEQTLFMPRFCTLVLEDAIRQSVFRHNIGQLQDCMTLRAVLCALNIDLYHRPGKGRLEKVFAMREAVASHAAEAMKNMITRYSLSIAETIQPP